MKISRTFRVFISSTFSDLKAEREALQQHVYPKLRDLCMQHGCRFQAIDLRWGVSEEAGLDQQTLNICIQELRRCQTTTPRPNFLVLLGQRYGWCPLPPQIPDAEFDQILKHIIDEKELQLLKYWYLKDENAVPAEFCLQPRINEFKNHQRWEEVEKQLHRILVNASNKANFTEEVKFKYEASATHHEIKAGALESADQSKHVFCFFRNIIDLPKKGDTKDFIDLTPTGEIDNHAIRKIQALKEELARNLPESNIKNYSTSWTENGINKSYLSLLCGDVEKRLSQIILEQVDNLSKQDLLEGEIEANEVFKHERIKNFVGREVQLKNVFTYLNNYNNHPLIIFGESGSGKSALLAKAAIESKISLPTHKIVNYFIGATPGSTDIRSLLTNICKELSRNYDKPATIIPGDYKELVVVFNELLNLVTPEAPLLLILDALDQLSSANTAHNLIWLPFNLPPNVSLIISTLKGNSYSILEKRLPATCFVNVPSMTKVEGEQLLDSWLKVVNRKLQITQRDEIINRFQNNGLPLYLKLAFEESRRWKSYSKIPDTLASPNIPGIINQLFSRLSLNSSHGKVLVSRSLGYIAVAKNGLTEDELLDVLSNDADVIADFRKRSPKSPEINKLPFVVWSLLFADVEPYLTVRRGDNTSLISFYHRQLQEAVFKNFLQEKEKVARHTSLAEYFLANAFISNKDAVNVYNLRTLSELPYQQRNGELWVELQNTLTDLNFIEAKNKVGATYDLVTDYNTALAETNLPSETRLHINEFARFIKSQAHILVHHPNLTIQQAANEPSLSGVGLSASKLLNQKKFNYSWLKKLNKSEEFDSCLMVLEGHIGEINECDMSPDGKLLVSAGLDKAVRIWDTGSGAEVFTLLGHEEPIATCAYSPDGNCIASCDYDGQIKLWDPLTGAELLPKLTGHNNQIEKCIFSSDGKRLLTACNDNTIGIWDVLKRKKIKMLSNHNRTAMACAFSPNGKLVATGDQWGDLTLWNGETYERIKKIRAHEAEIYSCNFSPSGENLITTSADKTFKCWLIDLSSEATSFIGHTEVVWKCCYSPDLKWIASVSADKTIKIWEVATAREVGTMFGHTSDVLSCSFLPEGDRLVTSSWDGTIRIWDVTWLNKLNTRMRNLEIQTDAFSSEDQLWLSCAFSPDGLQMLAGSEDKLKLWDVTTGLLLAKSAKHKDFVRNCAFSPDGEWIMSSASSQIYFWNRHLRKKFKKLNHNNLIEDCQISPDSKEVLSGSDDGRLNIWDIKTKKLKTTLINLEKEEISLTASAAATNWQWAATGTNDGDIIIVDLNDKQRYTINKAHDGIVMSLAISPDCKFLASGGNDMMVKIWDLNNNQVEPLAIMKRHTLPILFVTFSPNGQYLASSSRDGTLKLWDTRNFQLMKTLVGHATEFWTICFSPDSKRILSTSYDSTLRLWNAFTGSQLALLKGFRDCVNVCHFSPDGSRFVSANHYNSVKLYDTSTGVSQANLKGHEAEVLDCNFSSDGKLLVTGSADCKVNLWDVVDRKLYSTFKAHIGPVHSVCFSPDNKQILSASWDHTVKVWNTETSQLKMTLTGHEDWVQKATYSPDGKFIASCGLDKKIILWESSTGYNLYTLKGHEDSIDQCVFSPNSKQLLTAGGDSNLILWDLETATEISKFAGHTEQIKDCSFSPDGNLIVSASMDQKLCLWRTDGDKDPVTLFENNGWINCCSFSSDGKWVISGGNDKYLRLWNVPNASLECEYWVGAPIHSTEWHPSGKLFIIGDEQGLIHILEPYV
jgi:NACHT domain- and WD repeat-containing protein